MATIIDTPGVGSREERFFLIMACLMAATLVAGFGFNLAMGRSSFGLPLIFHVHAFISFGWVALYVVQNALVATGAVALHRKLGWLAVVWAPALLVAGTVMTLYSLRAHGGPPFFDENEFLIMNIVFAFAFAVLVGAAISVRRRTGWHRRLMFCSMALLLGPGVGRLLPSPLFIPWAYWVDQFFVPMLFPIAGMVFDLRTSGRVHRAWLWGVGLVVLAMIGGDLLAYSPLGYSITNHVIAGTPGTERTMKAFFPS